MDFFYEEFYIVPRQSEDNFSIKNDVEVAFLETTGIFIANLKNTSIV